MKASSSLIITKYETKYIRHIYVGLGTDHLIFRGGWDFFEKNSLFPIRSEKNKMSPKKLKIKSLFFIQ